MLVFGLALIGVSLALVVAEAHVSSGVLGALAGAAAVGGIVLLLVAAGAGAALVLVVALLAALAAGTLLLLARNHLVRSLRLRPRTGTEALVGHVGVVRSGGSPEAQ